MPNMPSWFPHRSAQIRDRLVSARLGANFTQVQVAEALNVPQQHISRIETGERRIDPAELEALACLYGKPLSFFYENEDQDQDA